MRNSLAIGIVLLLLGIAMLAWPVISYTTTDTVVDLGPVEVTREDEEHIALPPILGGVLVASGIALLVFGAGRPSSKSV
jgi:uncharacterized membrane protein HdeD (DUF308 family)